MILKTCPLEQAPVLFIQDNHSAWYGLRMGENLKYSMRLTPRRFDEKKENTVPLLFWTHLYFAFVCDIHRKISAHPAKPLTDHTRIYVDIPFCYGFFCYCSTLLLFCSPAVPVPHSRNFRRSCFCVWFFFTSCFFFTAIYVYKFTRNLDN